MQKIAKKIFISASVVFGILGIIYWITIPREGDTASDFNQTVLILLGSTVSVILSSFALSVAGKYLSTDD
jgi:putative Ca2+/H+ antiporter (TMEM165/GDT1 family)